MSNVEREIAMMQEEVLLKEGNSATNDVECDEKYEKDKSRGKRRKLGFKKKARKMQIGKIRKSSKNKECGIAPAKSGKYFTHCRSVEKKMNKKSSGKKVRSSDTEIKSGGSYKKLHDMDL